MVVPCPLLRTIQLFSYLRLYSLSLSSSIANDVFMARHTCGLRAYVILVEQLGRDVHNGQRDGLQRRGEAMEVRKVRTLRHRRLRPPCLPPLPPALSPSSLPTACASAGMSKTSNQHVITYALTMRICGSVYVQ